MPNYTITYANFLRELRELDPAERKKGALSRMGWLVALEDWADQADQEAVDGLPEALAECNGANDGTCPKHPELEFPDVPAAMEHIRVGVALDASVARHPAGKKR